MGYRGRIPKPTAVKNAEGNPGHRAINRAEPKPRVIVPECPSHLDSRARKEWRRLIPILLDMKVLTQADQIALANLCASYSRLVEAQKELSEAGLLYTTPSGI